MLKRLKNMWKLSKKDPKVIEKLDPESIEKLPDAPDGKAVFISEGTREEFEEQEKADRGLKKWYDTILGKRD